MWQMLSIRKLVTRNRNYFSKKQIALTDFKSVDLSTDNISLSEVIDLILWSTLSNKESKNDKK